MAPTRPTITTPGYDVGIFHYPGCTIAANKLREIRGDYAEIARIYRDRSIIWTETLAPADVVAYIEHEATHGRRFSTLGSGQVVSNYDRPAPRDPSVCHVCDGPEHADTTAKGGHKFWSIADAYREADEHDRHVTSSPEAAYVAQHRPY